MENVKNNYFKRTEEYGCFQSFQIGHLTHVSGKSFKFLIFFSIKFFFISIETTMLCDPNLFTKSLIEILLLISELLIEIFSTPIENILDARLADLSPNDVKIIIQKMIREHLGWLVVWGGFFGGLLGLIFSPVGLNLI